VKVRIKVGKGVTGAVRYVLGPGHDPDTGRFRAKTPETADRVAWVGGSDAFGWKVETAADIDQARREMEFDALNQASKTKKCVYDCVHIVLAWERGETPTREEMDDAARSHLKAQGMGNAKAVWVAHNDEDYFHLHIVASKINPATGYAYDLAGSWRKASVWAEQYEREHGGIVNVNRESANELRRAIRERDIDGVLEAMTKRNATFTAKQLERALQKEIYPLIGSSDGKKRSVELDRAQFANAILAHESVRRLAKEQDGPVERYTTKSVKDAETYVLNAAAGLKSDTGHAVGEDQRFATLKASKYDGISREQVRAFRHCTGDEGLVLIDGQAGTGKSFSMAAIRDAYEETGHRVIGLAFTNKVAKNLARDGFDHATTLHRELIDLNNGRTRWDAKTVVMVDEAAMVSTKLMAMIAAHAHDAGTKLILVGDDRQLSSLDHGGMFSELRKRHGAAVLSEVRRQYKPDEARASEMMAEGNFDAALAIYDRKGAIHWTRTQVEARAALVEKWAADTAAERDKSRFVFAYTNQDVDLLNVALRDVRKQRGELEWKDHSIKTAHGRFNFSAGDRIQFTGTDRRVGVENGLTGTIEAIDGTHIAVGLAGPEGKTINFDAANFDHFRHGYAGTVWKGQGDTLDATMLYHSNHWRSAPSYVALTRHREQTDLFVATNTAEDLKALAKQMARQDETRAASAFYQLDPIEPVRPTAAREILAQFAGEQFQRTAERMEREGRPWPALRPQHRQNNQPPPGVENINSSRPANAPDGDQQRTAASPSSRWSDEPSPAAGIGHRVRHRWTWRGVAGLIVSWGDHHPHRPGNISRRRRRGHGR
jgi:ATP-dependent exoDNAse (exonuclease V) alpha subunit